MENIDVSLGELSSIFSSKIDHVIIKMVLESYNGDKGATVKFLIDMLSTAPNDDFISPITDGNCCPGTSSDGNNGDFTQSMQQSGNNEISFMSSIEETPKAYNHLKRKCLILMRGLPGSGKTTLAKTLTENTGVIHSTDDFFYDFKGNYVFRSYALEEAHLWNKKRTEISMRDGVSPIIIDNTNIEQWEMTPYAFLALKYDYEINIVEPDTPWKFKPYELSRKNCHNVSKKKIELMLCKYDADVTVNSLLPIEYRKNPSAEKLMETPFKTNNVPSQSNFKTSQVSYGNISYLKEAKIENSNGMINSKTKFIGVAGNDAVSNENHTYQSETNKRDTNREVNPQELFSLLSNDDSSDSQVTDSPENSPTNYAWKIKSGEAQPIKEHISKSVQTSCENNLSDATPQHVVYGDAKRFIPGNDEITAFPFRNMPIRDVGVMTEEIMSGTCSASAIEQLTRVFPTCSEEAMMDVLEKSGYDLDWVVGILIDSGYEMSSSFDASTLSPDTASLVSHGSERSGTPSPQFSIFTNYSEDSSNSGEHANIKNEQSCSISTAELADDVIGYSPAGTKPEVLTENQLVKILLDKYSAKLLIRLFGPIGDITEESEMLKENRLIYLPLHLCETLHKYWGKSSGMKISMESKNNNNTLVNGLSLNQVKKNTPYSMKHSTDVALECADPFVIEPPQYFREIMDLEQAVDNSLKHKSNTMSSCLSNLNTCRVKEELPHANQKSVAFKGADPFLVERPKSFKELMEVEQAIDDSLKNYNSNVKEKRNLSSILRLARLREEFPHTDPAAVEDLFDKYSCNYDKTQIHLSLIYGGKKKVSSFKCISVREIEGANENFQETDLKSPEDYREEALMHFHKKQAATFSANENIRMKRHSVATYYAQLASYHSERQIEANENACSQILGVSFNNNGSNTLDLHFLHVAEAVRATQNFLAEKQKFLRESKLPKLDIYLITGYGKNSYQQPRIKPIIMKYLNSLHIKFHTDSPNRGTLHVFLEL